MYPTPSQLPHMSRNNCGNCSQPVPNVSTNLICTICKKYFHKRIECSALNAYDIRNLANRNFEWICRNCNCDAFPFGNIDSDELIDIFKPNVQNNQPKPTKKTKCGHCARKVKQNVFIFCKNCSKFYHLNHYNFKKEQFPLPNDWQCDLCASDCLPFSSISDDRFILTMKGFSEESVDKLSKLPSFSIQSLLDQLPGQKISSDQFLSNSIESRYFTPAQFIAENFPKKPFP